ncbi:hypothetical protein F4677DRAFT_309273 [Hypoxylon crocopeplum]|nr:hypothetical protein F4677DRAFT_309273 [Hypoxylon crocopeplum]
MAPLLPSLVAHARSLFSSARSAANDIADRSASGIPTSRTAALSRLGPLAARSILLARDDANSDSSNGDQTKVDPSKGVVNPQNINNTFVFVLFGLIGAAFVCTGIWFFFWAKNGGFHFKKNDWEDYKSTVLRRKGPNGTLLSGATPSTQLGGGSVYKDVDDGTATEYTGGLTQMTGDTGSTLTGITAGASDIAGREKRRQKRERKEREREKKKDRKGTRRAVGEDGVLVDEAAEADAKDHLRAYRHEKPARVGGINKQSEGSSWDGSTNPDNSTSAGSDLLSNRQSTPTNTPTKNTEKSGGNGKAGGIRKVYSTADRTADRENERLRAEARRLQEKGRAAGASSSGGVRRDFSFQRAKASHVAPSTVASSVQASTIEEESASAMGESSHYQAANNSRYLPPPGGWASEVGSDGDLGTKAYHHVIPGLFSSTVSGSGSGTGGSSVSGADQYDEKRKKRESRRYRRGDN